MTETNYVQARTFARRVCRTGTNKRAVHLATAYLELFEQRDRMRGNLEYLVGQVDAAIECLMSEESE